MSAKFNTAKVTSYNLGDMYMSLRSGTIANGTKHLNWEKEITPQYTKETTGLLEKVPGHDYFSDLYSFIVRRTQYLTRDGVQQTRIEKIGAGKGSTTTYFENGIRTIKHTFDSKGNLIKTTQFDAKGLPVKLI